MRGSSVYPEPTELSTVEQVHDGKADSRDH